VRRAPRISHAIKVATETEARAVLVVVVDPDGACGVSYAERAVDRDVVAALLASILSTEALADARLLLSRPTTHGDHNR